MAEKAELLAFLEKFFAGQKLAVMATSEGGRPYLSLMAFGASPDLQHLVVATDRGTRKYRNLKADPQVALLMDNRTHQPELEAAVAVSARGRATEVEAGDRGPWLELYQAKHPELAGFAAAPECALIKVRVESYLVSRFREVKELPMPP